MNRSKTLVLALTLLGALVSPARSQSLALWRFEGNRLDSTGHGNHGAGGYLVTDPIRGRVLQLAGNSLLYSPFVVGHSKYLEPVVGGVELWVNLRGAQNADLFGKTTTDPATGVGISVYGLRVKKDGGLVGFIANHGAPGKTWTDVQGPKGVVCPYRWTRVRLSWNGHIVSLRVNGKLIDAQPYKPVPGTGLSYNAKSSFFVGQDTVGPFGGRLRGRVDNVRIFGKTEEDCSPILVRRPGDIFLYPLPIPTPPPVASKVSAGVIAGK